ncbi:MAG: ABC transporter permease [Proteobacteria bacterium]|nr:ABC transporter permease [Pseudomonadota bacterium]
MNQALLVAKNLGRRKLRTSLMLVAIFIAFFLYGFLECFNRAFHAGDNASAAERLITVNRINFTMPLPVNYAERIRQVQGVKAVTYQSWFGGYFQDTREPLFMMAVQPDTYLDVYPNLQMPPEQRRAWLATRTGLAIGRTVADKYHWKVGDHLPIASNIYSRKDGAKAWEFEVSAVFAAPDDPQRDSLVLMHHDYFDEGVTFGRDQINMAIMTTASPTLNDQIEKAIDSLFANSEAETTTDTAAAFNRAFAAQFGNIALIITLVVATAFAAILMIVGNTMVMAVRERTREIGVLKTLGFSGSTILAQILSESLLLALLGALLGLGAAAGAVSVASRFLSGFGSNLHVSTAVFLGGIGWAVLLGLVTGAIPAWTGMRLRIAAALGRH